jgi:hypothetical protein
VDLGMATVTVCGWLARPMEIFFFGREGCLAVRGLRRAYQRMFIWVGGCPAPARLGGINNWCFLCYPMHCALCCLRLRYAHKFFKKNKKQNLEHHLLVSNCRSFFETLQILFSKHCTSFSFFKARDDRLIAVWDGEHAHACLQFVRALGNS